MKKLLALQQCWLCSEIALWMRSNKRPQQGWQEAVPAMLAWEQRPRALKLLASHKSRDLKLEVWFLHFEWEIPWTRSWCLPSADTPTSAHSQLVSSLVQKGAPRSPQGAAGLSTRWQAEQAAAGDWTRRVNVPPPSASTHWRFMSRISSFLAAWPELQLLLWLPFARCVKIPMQWPKSSSSTWVKRAGRESGRVWGCTELWNPHLLCRTTAAGFQLWQKPDWVTGEGQGPEHLMGFECEVALFTFRARSPVSWQKGSLRQ